MTYNSPVLGHLVIDYEIIIQPDFNLTKEIIVRIQADAQNNYQLLHQPILKCIQSTNIIPIKSLVKELK